MKFDNGGASANSSDASLTNNAGNYVDRGRVRKESFNSRAFAFAIEDEELTAGLTFWSGMILENPLPVGSRERSPFKTAMMLSHSLPNSPTPRRRGLMIWSVRLRRA